MHAINDGQDVSLWSRESDPKTQELKVCNEKRIRERMHNDIANQIMKMFFSSGACFKSYRVMNIQTLTPMQKCANFS